MEQPQLDYENPSSDPARRSRLGIISVILAGLPLLAIATTICAPEPIGRVLFRYDAILGWTMFSAWLAGTITGIMGLGERYRKHGLCMIAVVLSIVTMLWALTQKSHH